MSKTQFTLSADLPSLADYRPEVDPANPDVAPPLAFPIISMHYDLTDDKLKVEYPSGMEPKTVASLMRTFADELETE